MTFTLDKRAFAYWNAQIHDWHVKTGEFTIEVGQSSRHIDVSAAVNVTSTVRVKKHYTMDTIFMDLMADPSAAAVMAPMLEVIKRRFPGQRREHRCGKGSHFRRDEHGDDAVYAPSRRPELRRRNGVPGDAGSSSGSAEQSLISFGRACVRPSGNHHLPSGGLSPCNMVFLTIKEKSM